jgi:hypothetical protein
MDDTMLRLGALLVQVYAFGARWGLVDTVGDWGAGLNGWRGD